MQHNSNTMLSSRYTTFSVENIVKGYRLIESDQRLAKKSYLECKTCCISYHPTKLHTIISAIYVPQSNNCLLNKKSLLLEFELEQPLSPIRWIFYTNCDEYTPLGGVVDRWGMIRSL